MKNFEIMAVVDGKKIIQTVQAVDKFDAVDVFEIENGCYNNGKEVSIHSVEEELL